MEDLETRVGYKTISVLLKEVNKYIDLFTINGEYKGDLKYIQIKKDFDKYMLTSSNNKIQVVK